jgi:D-serine deaminase-like pyridoxal phosphate-dependent protein
LKPIEKRMKPGVTNKTGLDTPCLVLDLDILERNVRNMQAAVSRAGKHLRPHAKTHKCSSLARMQVQAGALGVCAAKLSEAEALVSAGLQDILITSPLVTPHKVEKLAGLVANCPSLMVVVDHPDAVEMLDARLGAHGRAMGVLLDIDAGLHRTGVKPADAPALANRIAACSNLRLKGVQAYAGQVQHIPDFADRRLSSHRCLRDAAAAFRELRATAPGCTIFSTSGTGTFDIDLEIEEVTEIQAGSYVLMDTEYLDIGSALNAARFEAFEPALTLLTTVISANHEAWVSLDAGLKSLYRDGGVPRIAGPARPQPEFDWFGDEFGMLRAAGQAPLPRLGSVVELLVSHCDPTVNLFNDYYLTRGNEVVGRWPIDLRGCSQ